MPLRLVEAGFGRAEQRDERQAGVALGSHMSVRHCTMPPSGSTEALKSSSCGGPLGSQPCSSSRIHCTRTGRPTARDRIAASAAASSWPFMP